MSSTPASSKTTRQSSITQYVQGRSKRKSSEHEETTQLGRAIKYLTEAPSDLKIRGNVELKLSVETVEKEAETNGLEGSVITQLVDVVAKSVLGEKISTKLIRSLIPVETVPEEAVVKAVSWMCTNKPSTTIQCTLVRWLLVVYDCLENHSSLHRLYSFLFYFLHNDVLSPHVCHLLHRLTTKDDVKMFRVRALLQLQNKMGAQPHLMGLLALYKAYCPHLVSISIPRRRQVFFKKYDRVWSQKVMRIQEMRASSHEMSLRLVPNPLPSPAKAMGSKRRREEILPDCPLLHKHMPAASGQNTQSTVDYITNTQLPSQMGSVLRDADLQFLLLYHQDAVAPLRLQYWLDHVLYQEIISKVTECSPEVEELLQSLVTFTDIIQEGVPVCEYFLAQYLHMWNGKDYAACILKLLSRLRVHSFQELHVFLEPLRNIFLTSTVYVKCQILSCLEELIMNYGRVELDRLRETQRCQNGVTRGRQGHRHSPQCYSVFVEEVEEGSGLNTLTELISFSEVLACMGLRQTDNHALLLHYALSLSEQVTTLQSSVLYFVTPPTEELVYACLFSANAVAVVRMATLIMRNRNNCERLKKMKENGDLSMEDRQLLMESLSFSSLNMFIIDFVNTLWRYRAFISVPGTETVYRLLSKEHLSQVSAHRHTPSQPSSAHKHAHRHSHTLSIHEHQAFLPFTAHFLSQKSSSDIRVHPASIRKSRDDYLDYLEQEHLGDIPKFVATLVKRRKSRSHLEHSGEISD